MLLLNRYYLRQFLPALIICVSLFTFLLFLDKLFSLSHLLIVKNVELLLLIKLSITVLLSFLPLTIPIGLLSSTVLIFSRAAENNEILAVRAAGVNLIRLFLPFWSIYFFLFLMTAVFNFYISPHFYKLYKKMYTEIALRHPWVKIEPRKFTTLSGYSVLAFNVKRNTIDGINIYKLSDSNSGKPVACITAKKAKYAKITAQQIILALYDGEIHNLDASEVNVLYFKRYVLSIPIRTSTYTEGKGTAASSAHSLKELTYDELITELQQQKGSSTILTECFLRLNLALSCFTLPFLGLPLGIKLRKGDKITGISLAILVAVVFYVLFVLGVTLGEKSNIVSPQVAVSLPNIVGVIYGIIVNVNLLRK
jgi:lipopolysaccharide export system permease protein